MAFFFETVNTTSLHKKTTAKVFCPGGDTSFFQFMQKFCRKIHYLFIIAVNYAMRKAISNLAYCGFTLEKAKSRRHPALCITAIDYADDIALLSDSVDKAEKLLHNVEMAAKLIGLHTYQNKHVLTFNKNPLKLTTINKKCIKLTNDFLYLGSWNIFQRERR